MPGRWLGPWIRAGVAWRIVTSVGVKSHCAPAIARRQDARRATIVRCGPMEPTPPENPATTPQPDDAVPAPAPLPLPAQPQPPAIEATPWGEPLPTQPQPPAVQTPRWSEPQPQWGQPQPPTVEAPQWGQPQWGQPQPQWGQPQPPGAEAPQWGQQAWGQPQPQWGQPQPPAAEAPQWGQQAWGQPQPQWAQPATPVAPPRPNRFFAMSDDRFTTLVAIIITVVSMLIAAGAWRTTDAASRASDLDSLVIQQLARRQQEMESLSGMIDLDLRLVARYQSYVLAAVQLDAAATAAGEPGTTDRSLLEVEAQGQRALARVMNQFFLGSFPSVDADGIATYDPDHVLKTLTAGSSLLADLQPEATAVRAARAHAQTAAFVLIVILLSACLVLLSIAQTIRRSLRWPLALSGTGLAGLALLLLLLVEFVMFPVA